MNLVQRLHEIAQMNPHKTAYLFEQKETSYGELDAYVTMFANSLRELGIQKGDHVGIIVGNSPYFIIGLYGAWRVGATVIPINPIYTADEISYILNNGDVKVILTLDQLFPLMQGLSQHIQRTTHIILCETSPTTQLDQLQLPYQELKAFSKMLIPTETFLPEIIDEQDVAVILYTSGTTGKPKGAMLTHKNIYSNATDIATYLKMTSDDKVIGALPMFHVFCLTVVVNASLTCGATILIMPRFSPQELFTLANENQGTIFAGVPTMYNFILQVGKQLQLGFSDLRLCISGGAAMPVALLKEFEAQFHVMVSEGYGLSEASPVTCFNPIDRPRKPGSIGMSIINVENKIVDELGEVVPIGEVGELIVRGPNVMKGYYKMPEDTMMTIRNGWLYTGDLARMDEEGYFYIVDRKKDMVIVGGYNVYPREVEEVIYTHPNVLEVVVLGVPDEQFGEAVVAFVVLKENQTLEEELQNYCREHLAKYKIPTKIEFLDELPKNTTGKILRRALKEQVIV